MLEKIEINKILKILRAIHRNQLFLFIFGKIIPGIKTELFDFRLLFLFLGYYLIDNVLIQNINFTICFERKAVLDLKQLIYFFKSS